MNEFRRLKLLNMLMVMFIFMGGAFAFINENNICFYTDGIQYTIASNEVEVMEMIKMGESLKTTDIK